MVQSATWPAVTCTALLCLLSDFSPVSGFVHVGRTRSIDRLRDNKLHIHNTDETPVDASLRLSTLLSARTARITVPLSSLLSSLPAEAGVGTVEPFDEARKREFPGSIANSVASLRLSSSLRKRGYYKGSSVVGTLSSFPTPTDLGDTLSQLFADGSGAVVLGDASSFETFRNRCLAGKPKRALVLFGSDVAISQDGEVGNLQGDLQAAERYIEEKLVGTVPEVALLAGVFIHKQRRGQDAGEGFFQPLILKISTSSGETDLYKEAFGDLATPRNP